MNYDEAMGSMNLSLWAVDVGASAPSLITSSSSGTGREVISFDGYVAGDLLSSSDWRRWRAYS